jgi:hypothetical protein
MTDQATPLTEERWGGVEGNARLTGMSGALLFVVLAAEGVTVLQVRQTISIHVFIGMLLVPFVLLKLASTTFRFGHYYRGDAAYVKKGAPPAIMRLTGPLIALSTLAVLGTGIALIALGRSARWMRDIHKLSFFAFGLLIAIHVIGHLRETPTLAVADLRDRESATPVLGARVRLVVLTVTLVVAVGLAIVSLGWVGDFGRDVGREVGGR